MSLATNWLDANFINLLNGVGRGLLLFIVAAGLSVVFGMMQLLNLAHGAVYLIAGFVAFEMAADGTGFVPALLVAGIVGAVLGVILAATTKPVIARGHLTQALLTLGLAYVLSEMAFMRWGYDVRSVAAPSGLDQSVQLFGHTYPAYRLFVIAAGALIAGVIYFVIVRSSMGARIRAAVDDREMLAATGVDVNKLFVFVLAFASALAALAGVLAAPVIGVYPGLQFEMLVLALIVVVVGGLGSLRGAFLAALVVGQAQTTLVAALPQFSSFVLFGVMAAVLLVKPSGLFGARTA